jgi:hypothetical protein
MSAWSEANRAMWDERVPIHVEGEFYDLESFVRGGSSNLPFEVEELGDVAVNNRCYEWNHGIGAVVSAVIDAGLQVEFLHEHQITEFERWPMLVRGEDGRYRLPERTPSIPLMYSLRARRPA